MADIETGGAGHGRSDRGASELGARLADFGSRLDAKLREIEMSGVTEGIEREAAADMRARHASLTEAAATGGRPLREIEDEMSALRSNFEHWLAHIDAEFLKRG